MYKQGSPLAPSSHIRTFHTRTISRVSRNRNGGCGERWTWNPKGGIEIENRNRDCNRKNRPDVTSRRKTSNRLFVLSTLRRLKEKHLLLHDGIVLHHAERAVHTRPDHCAVVAGHGHGDEPDGNGSGLCCWDVSGLIRGDRFASLASGPASLGLGCRSGGGIGICDDGDRGFTYLSWPSWAVSGV